MEKATEAQIKEGARTLVLAMLPSSNLYGCDIDSPCFEQMVREMFHESERDAVVDEAKRILQHIGTHGFDILNERAP